MSNRKVDSIFYLTFKRIQEKPINFDFVGLKISLILILNQIYNHK